MVLADGFGVARLWKMIQGLNGLTTTVLGDYSLQMDICQMLLGIDTTPSLKRIDSYGILH